MVEEGRQEPSERPEVFLDLAVQMRKIGGIMRLLILTSIIYKSSILAVAVAMLGACGFGEELCPAWVASSRQSLMERFFWPGTSLFYDYRTGEGLYDVEYEVSVVFSQK